MGSLDEFVARFTDLDLRAWGAESARSYRARYLRALGPPSARERARVRAAFDPQALAEILRAGGLVLPRDWPPCRVLINSDPSIEGNMAHTMELHRGAPPTIVLPRAEFAAPDFDAVLHHEYVHVLQRRFPAEFADWYRRHWGLVPAATPPALAGRQRANPDAPGSFATGGAPGPFATYTITYRSHPVRGLTDVQPMAVHHIGAAPSPMSAPRAAPSHINHPHELLADAVEAAIGARGGGKKLGR